VKAKIPQNCLGDSLSLASFQGIEYFVKNQLIGIEPIVSKNGYAIVLIEFFDCGSTGSTAALPKFTLTNDV